MSIPFEDSGPVLYKKIFFLVPYEDVEETIETYITRGNICNDENEQDYEPPESEIDPDAIPEKFEINHIKFLITKTKKENSPRSLPKVHQKYKREKKRIEVAFS